jgi:hypothetical protein
MSVKKFKVFFEAFKFKKLSERPKTSNIELGLEAVINFLNSNGYKNWDDLIDLPKFQRDVINLIIDDYCSNTNDLKELKFLLRLKLSNPKQLKVLLSEYEELEDYEKCQLIHQQINSK